MKQVAYINPNLCDRSPFCPVKRVCPAGAVEQKGGFFSASVPKVDEDKCTGCAKCTRYCPHGAVTMKKI